MDGYRSLSISGWTQPHDFLTDLFSDVIAFDYSDHPNLESIAKNVLDKHIDVLIGWSLGGIIARQLILRDIVKPKALILLSSPFQFVKDEQVQHAMPRDTFELFYQNYRDETERTVARFDGLMAKGDANAKSILRGMRHHNEVLSADKWLPWMDFLRDYSADLYDYSALPPTLLVHGMQDAIVPFEQSLLLSKHLKEVEHIAWEKAGHALHLHDGILLKQQITEFVAKVI